MLFIRKIVGDDLRHRDSHLFKLFYFALIAFFHPGIRISNDKDQDESDYQNIWNNDQCFLHETSSLKGPILFDGLIHGKIPSSDLICRNPDLYRQRIRDADHLRGHRAL